MRFKFCEQAARSDEELSVRWKPILAMLKNFAHLNDAEPFTQTIFEIG